MMNHTATLSAIPVRNASHPHRSDRHGEQAAIPNEIGELAKVACFPLSEWLSSLFAIFSRLKSGQYQPRLISDPSISS